MKICERCGFVRDDAQRFCSQCGTQAITPSRAAPRFSISKIALIVVAAIAVWIAVAKATGLTDDFGALGQVIASIVSIIKAALGLK